ncbi:TPA: morphogenetic protein [Salmonella enterica subsp. enterica]|nr:morphogenetic protein [Salmonella enterica subsp. enterica serovar Soerenga]
MNERGMIFNAEMVRAILDGRKTQTRRPVKNVRPDNCLTIHPATATRNGTHTHVMDAPKHGLCPFGAVGDRIWVRETFQGPLFDYEQMQSYLEDSSKFEKPEFCQYAADGKPAPEYYDADDNLHCGWRPSIHMPRWASRILLEITDVRVERLHSISERDALREGLLQLPASGRYCLQPGMQYFGMASHSAKEVYSWLWASIYGEESWDANPWVWVIEYKRVEGGAL